MKKIFMLLALLASSALFGENLVVNADFSQVEKGKIGSWVKFGPGKVTALQAEKAVRLTSEDYQTSALSLRQNVAAKIEPGKKYLVQCQVKSSDFIPGEKCDYGILLINKNWKGSAGVRRFKITNDNKWVTVKRVVTIPANWSQVNAVLFIYNGKGSLDFSNIKITEVK